MNRAPEAAITILRLLLACGMICHEEQELVRELIRGPRRRVIPAAARAMLSVPVSRGEAPLSRAATSGEGRPREPGAAGRVTQASGFLPF